MTPQDASPIDPSVVQDPSVRAPQLPNPAGLTRRRFLRHAAVGASAVGIGALVPTFVLDDRGSQTQVAAADVALDGPPVLVYVRDAARGEAVIMAGTTERIVTDRALVATLLRAQQAAEA